jgi:serine/threonine protein kinase
MQEVVWVAAGAGGRVVERCVHVFQLQAGKDRASQQPLIESAAAFMRNLGHPSVLSVLSHACRPAVKCAEACKCCLEVQLDTEHCNGGTLAAAVHSGLFCRSVVREQWAVATSVLSDVAHGMHFLHSQGICHGTLNPDNIYLQVRRPPMSLCPIA